MINHEAEASRLFRGGANCAQSVFAAFAEELGIEKDYALMISSPFGGGMGRMREVCGAVTGALMVLGTLKGYDSVDDRSAINGHYAAVQDFAARFREIHGSIICRDLLNLRQGEKTTPPPTIRSDAFYKERPCDRCIADAVEILEKLLSE